MPEERTQHSEDSKGRSGPEDLRGSAATFDRVEKGAAAIATLSTKDHEVLESRVRGRSHVCLACGQASVHRFLYRKNGCDILRCEQCGLGRAETMGFDPESYYTSDYFSGKRPDGYADYIGTENILRREFAGTVEFIRKFRASGRLLDVGCAYGFFLQEAKRFFEVSGIELAEDAAEHCRLSGLNVFTGQADETRLGRLGTTDVIVLLDVIEHLPSPRDTIALLMNHLDHGGIIVITTGDFGSLYSRVAGAHWRLMTPPQHLWFFTLASMQAMATSLGLEVEHLDHPWKVVPLSLISFQLARMSGLGPKRLAISNWLGLPVNLFDAMRVVLRRPSR
ncbi:class I SAM-dependent methyltransferase [Bradyrhizobium sp. SSUT77]|uniref:class I SAM-dependent methyltransferase n=1 Tax=Bradyrhizobium sp. SSUT77 TaxID=3040603 RepID=UPI00244BDFA8|nr:class I SAM-dependent methyltransferase [Bradyrhizobium sp. SSUT77]MDH2347089.1 class I SAM-dependent methyltransferase [Bradyrhizobium sp. SSUT77]